MSELRAKDFIANLFALLKETFEGSPMPTYYLDGNAGFFHTLERISAEAASKVFHNGTTIAAQVAHTRVYLDVLEQSLKGHTLKVDWEASFRPETVDQKAWAQLQVDLRSAYESVTTTLETVSTWDDAVGDGLCILAHSAYHLGAIRQMMRAVGALS